MKIGLRQEMREAAPISIVPATSPPSRTACRMEYLPVTPAPVRWHKKNTWKLGAPRSRARETIRVGYPDSNSIGTVKLNTVPFGLFGDAHIFPPCVVTICWQIESPSPMPVAFVVTNASNR